MENRSLVTIAEHSKEKILYMLEMAKQFEMNPNRRLLQGKVVATLFFEPSTRTRLSFETACELLKHSQKQVSEICFTVGFNDLPHFVRVFTNTLGMSPSKYRRQFQ